MSITSTTDRIIYKLQFDRRIVAFGYLFCAVPKIAEYETLKHIRFALSIIAIFEILFCIFLVSFVF